MKLVCTLFIAAALVACESRESPLPLVGTLERDRIELTAEASERIVEIRVIEGQEVELGELLMRLNAERQLAEVKVASAARDRQAERLAELIRGPRQERIREAQARLEGARDNLSIQGSEFDRVSELVARQLASESDLDRAKNSLDSARADVDVRTAALDELLEGTTAEELGQAQAQLAEAEARLELARITAARLDIVAPRAGRIDAIPYKRGEQPPVRATVIVMLADQAPFARVYIPEPLRARIVPGVAASIRVDGIDRAFAGRVRYVSSDATFTPYFALTQRDRSRLAFVSEVTLTESDARELPVGVPVEVDFPSLQ